MENSGLAPGTCSQGLHTAGKRSSFPEVHVDYPTRSHSSTEAASSSLVPVSGPEREEAFSGV